MNSQQRMAVLREVAQFADEFYPVAEKFGKSAAQGLTRSKRAQVTGLEQIANSALKTSDVFDFIKIRIARQKEWQKDSWGLELLGYLSKELRSAAKNICERLTIDIQSTEGIEVYLLLIRAFVHQFSAQYEYQCYLLSDDEREDG